MNGADIVSIAGQFGPLGVQGSVTGGDNTLDGVDWWAEGQ